MLRQCAFARSVLYVSFVDFGDKGFVGCVGVWPVLVAVKAAFGQVVEYGLVFEV